MTMPDDAAPTTMPDAGGTPVDATASGPAYLRDPLVQRWLGVLLKGKPEDQARARTEIALILESRGHEAEAEEAYWTNVQIRARDRRPYERLIAMYRARRDRLSETLVRRTLDEVFPPPASPAPPTPHPDEAPDRFSAGAPPSHAAPPSRRPAAIPEPDPDAPITPWDAAAATDGTPAPRRPGTDGAVADGRPRPRMAGPPPEASTPPLPRTDDQLLGGHAPSGPSRGDGGTPNAARRLTLRSAAHHSGDGPVLGSGAAPRRRLRRANAAASPATAQSAPPPEIRAAGRSRTRGVGPQANRVRGRRPDALTLIALVLACIGAAGLLAFFMIWPGRPGGEATPRISVTPAPGAPLGAAGLARCGDGAARFPGADNPEEAVLAAYRENGVDVNDPNGATARYVRESARHIVGTWIATTLLAERVGQPAPTLVEWVGTAPEGHTLANALLGAGRSLDAFLTLEQWDEIASSPPNTCEGAFVQNPRNAPLLTLVEDVVAP